MRGVISVGEATRLGGSLFLVGFCEGGGSWRGLARGACCHPCEGAVRPGEGEEG